MNRAPLKQELADIVVYNYCLVQADRDSLYRSSLDVVVHEEFPRMVVDKLPKHENVG